MKKYPTARFSFLLHTIIAIFLFLVFYAIANYVGDNFNNSVEARNIEAILNIANLFFIFYFFYSMKNLVAYKKYIIRFKKKQTNNNETETERNSKNNFSQEEKKEVDEMGQEAVDSLRKIK